LRYTNCGDSMGTGYRKAFGKWGEEQAATYLASKGYVILDCNYRFGHSEVDIIAEKDGILSFVEIKTRGNQAYGLAEYAFTPAKLAALERAVYGYFDEHPDVPTRWSIDLLVVETSAPGQAPTFLFYENLGEALS